MQAKLNPKSTKFKVEKGSKKNESIYICINVHGAHITDSSNAIQMRSIPKNVKILTLTLPNHELVGNDDLEFALDTLLWFKGIDITTLSNLFNIKGGQQARKALSTLGGPSGLKDIYYSRDARGIKNNLEPRLYENEAPNMVIDNILFLPDDAIVQHDAYDANMDIKVRAQRGHAMPFVAMMRKFEDVRINNLPGFVRQVPDKRHKPKDLYLHAPVLKAFPSLVENEDKEIYPIRRDQDMGTLKKRVAKTLLSNIYPGVTSMLLLGESNINGIIPGYARGELVNKALTYVGFDLKQRLYQLTQPQNRDSLLEQLQHPTISKEVNDKTITLHDLIQRFRDIYPGRNINIVLLSCRVPYIVQQLPQKGRMTTIAENLRDAFFQRH